MHTVVAAIFVHRLFPVGLDTLGFMSCVYESRATEKIQKGLNRCGSESSGFRISFRSGAPSHLVVASVEVGVMTVC